MTKRGIRMRIINLITIKNIMRILKTHPLFSIVNGMVIDLPVPSNISYL
jgi:hypothetical protein